LKGKLILVVKKFFLYLEILIWRIWGQIQIWCGAMTLEELLKDLENKILRIKKRYYYLDAILKEIVRVTDGKTFNIENDIVYQMIWDSHEMLIIDLASLYRGMCQSGGFFGKLKIHAARLKTVSHRKLEIGEPNIIESAKNPLSLQDRERVRREIKEDMQRFQAKNLEQVLVSIFPDLKSASTKRANHNHIDALKDNFWKKAEEMTKDRDIFRAHKYEEKEHKHGEDIKQITLKDIKVHFDNLEEMINAIRLVSTMGTLAYSDMNWASSKNTAEDIVDLVMMGSNNRIFNEFQVPDVITKCKHDKAYYYLFREDFYKKNPAPFGKENPSDENN
jgi:hypothetical protein